MEQNWSYIFSASLEIGSYGIIGRLDYERGISIKEEDQSQILLTVEKKKNISF